MIGAPIAPVPVPALALALGCMRLSTDADRDEERAAATLKAALEAGFRTFDTARAYAWDDGELGHNERLVARAVRAHGQGLAAVAAASAATSAAAPVRIVTKGGMRRPGGRWEPDGRAKSLRADCEASLEALGGLAIDVYLVHAPDPRVPWATTVRALAQLVETGRVRSVGVSNVTRRQLDEALAIAPVAAVEIAWSPFVDEALRGGVVARCLERGIEVLAHSPLGGPQRAGKLGKHAELAAAAARHGVTPQRVALAALAEVDARIVPVVGARRPETVHACVAPLTLTEEERAAIEARTRWRATLYPRAPLAGGAGGASDAGGVSVARGASDPRGAADGELVLVMGVQGSGKTTLARDWVERGYARMNRDERGGTMKALHEAIDAALSAGVWRIVADNTYTTRASRHGALAIAREHGVPVRGVWLDTPVAEAQRNVVLRMLEVHGRLLEPREMERARDAASIGPGALWRLLRAVDPPEDDEGFASLEVVPFARRASEDAERAARFVAIDAIGAGETVAAASAERVAVTAPGELVLVFGWAPGATAEAIAKLADRVGAPVACCTHPGGPARCWCRPPLPGLVLALAKQHRVAIEKSVLVGTSDAHARMAAALGATYLTAPSAPVH